MTARRRQRTSAALLVAGAVAVAGLSVVVGSARSQALPPGVYIATFTEGPVEVVVKDDGSVELDAPASVEVDLEYSDDGEILDAFTVATADGAWAVDVDVDDDGDYAVTTTPVVPSGHGTTPGEPDETSGETPQRHRHRTPRSRTRPRHRRQATRARVTIRRGSAPRTTRDRGTAPTTTPVRTTGERTRRGSGPRRTPDRATGPTTTPGRETGSRIRRGSGPRTTPARGTAPTTTPGRETGSRTTLPGTVIRATDPGPRRSGAE